MPYQTTNLQGMESMNPYSPSSCSSNPFQEVKVFSRLHSIHKPSQKRWRRSSSSGLPDKLYVVHPSRFRKLVQELTGDPKFTSRRLREAAPAPLNLVPKRAMASLQQENADTSLLLQPPFSSGPEKLFADDSSELLPQPRPSAEPEKHSNRSSGSFGSFSPTSCSFLLLSPIFSPGTMALLEQSAVP